MSHDEKYDLFIAYYGNSEKGSENEARKLYNQLQGAQIAPGKYVRAYFHPATNPYGSFEETPMIVARTPLFLLVVDRDIPTNSSGQLLRQREDGSLRNLYEEVQTFHDSPMYKEYTDKNAVKLFITDSFNFKDAERLHPIFSGTIALSTGSQVLDWIRHFYKNTYCDRLYQKCKYLVHNRRDEFYRGRWVPEVEEFWQSLHHEHLGRSLIIYYTYRVDTGDRAALQKLRGIVREFERMTIQDHSTREIVAKIKEKYLKYF